MKRGKEHLAAELDRVAETEPEPTKPTRRLGFGKKKRKPLTWRAHANNVVAGEETYTHTAPDTRGGLYRVVPRYVGPALAGYSVKFRTAKGRNQSLGAAATAEDAKHVARRHRNRMERRRIRNWRPPWSGGG